MIVLGKGWFIDFAQWDAMFVSVQVASKGCGRYRQVDIRGGFICLRT